MIFGPMRAPLHVAKVMSEAAKVWKLEEVRAHFAMSALEMPVVLTMEHAQCESMTNQSRRKRSVLPVVANRPSA